jgi:hypothetical protein
MRAETIIALGAAISCVMGMAGGLWRLHQVATRVEHAFDYFALEHELLMTDYAERKDIHLNEVPTRLTRAPWWKK